jgi:hypothetical protein
LQNKNRFALSACKISWSVLPILPLFAANCRFAGCILELSIPSSNSFQHHLIKNASLRHYWLFAQTLVLVLFGYCLLRIGFDSLRSFSEANPKQIRSKHEEIPKPERTTIEKQAYTPAKTAKCGKIGKTDQGNWNAPCPNVNLVTGVAEY